jgi:hypothetical protein
MVPCIYIIEQVHQQQKNVPYVGYFGVIRASGALLSLSPSKNIFHIQV